MPVQRFAASVLANLCEIIVDGLMSIRELKD